MKIFTTNIMLIAVAACSTLIMACSDNSPIATTENAPALESKKVKNVILMIGDGMGVQQVGLLEEYVRRAPNSILPSTVTGLQQIADNGRIGLSMTAPMGANPSLVVDSACSASQLATGMGSISEAIGLDDNGNKVETILEKAKKMGKATGLVTDTRITHATPAAFGAHQPHRSFENEIAEDLLTTQVDVLLGGGARHWLPQDTADKKSAYALALGGNTSVIKKSKRQDSRNLMQEAKDAGYTLAFDKTQLANANGPKLLGLFDDSAMNDGIEYSNCKAGAVSEKCSQEPSLTQMTMKALDILSQDQDGFFLMIEGGQIDWAGHVNDAGWLLHEMLKFDEAVAAVYQWVKQRGDTLLVVTADHETGGFGFSYHNHNIPAPVKLLGDGMKDKDYQPQFNFGALSILDKIHQQSQSFYDIYSQVNSDWNFTASTPAEWKTAVNASLHIDFNINDADAKNIAARTAVPEAKIVASHKYLSATEIPLIKDFSDFYVYGSSDQGVLISRAIASKQNVVWATGTHTAAPVPVYAYGPSAIIDKFSTMQHHVEVGQKLIEALIIE